MKKLIWLAALMAAFPLMAQTLQKGSSEKNPPSTTANFVDYTTSHGPATILHAPCAGTGAAVNPWTVPDKDCLNSWFSSGISLTANLPPGSRGGFTCGAEMFRASNSLDGCQMGATNVGAGSGTTNVTANGTHMGIVQCTTGTTATGDCGFQLGGNGSTAIATLANVLLGLGTLSTGSVVLVPTLSTVTETFNLYIGGVGDQVLTTAASAESPDAVYFRCVDCRTGVGSWSGVVRSNGADTGTCATNIVIDTNFHTYEITVNAAATSSTFSIDGATSGNGFCTVTATHPTGAGRETTLMPAAIVKTASAGTPSLLQLDAYWARYQFTTPR